MRRSVIWNDTQLRQMVPEVTSYAGLLRGLGLKVGGGTQSLLKQRVAVLGISTSHFKGQSWLLGIKRGTSGNSHPLSEILIEDSGYQSTNQLKKRLIAAGLLEQRCAQCGLTEWQGKLAPLELDHINGRRRDNRLENLRILCSNCHAQTPTYCSRNIRACGAIG